ncbi:MAG: DUF934 domain-containing protein [Pseudomonadota bacterium]
MQLLRDGRLTALSVARIDDEAEAAQRLVSLADFDGAPGTAVLVEPDSDTSVASPMLLDQERIYIDFPVFTDGRGYSHARTLRLLHGYAGELVAFGDVRRDQVEFMLRVGIDAFAVADDVDADALVQALDELSHTVGHRFYAGAVAPAEARP